MAPQLQTLPFSLLLTLLVLTPPSCSSTLQRIVPAEWQSTITGTINSTIVFQGNAFKSASQQTVLLHNGGGGNISNSSSSSSSSSSSLWRVDLLSFYSVVREAAAASSIQNNATSSMQASTCTRSQLYNSEILLLFDFLLAPGTIHQGRTTINNRQCDIWVSPFALNTPWGKFVCLETSRTLAYQRPVRYWLKLPALDFVVDFENDFQGIESHIDIFFLYLFLVESFVFG